jgi:Xaa-Pro aminopeptidase
MKSVRIDAQLIVAASETDANMLYATRFFAPDAFIYLRHDGRTVVVMSDLELDRARRQATVDQVLSRSELERELQKRRRVINTAAVLQHLFSKRKICSVLVPSNFPLGLADQLRRRGLRVITRSDAFFPKREIKTEEEIRWITKAQRAAEAAMQAAITMIRQSRISSAGVLLSGGTKLTAEAVKERIAIAALQHGCIASHTIVACGERGCDPHDEGGGPLRAHQPIILDVFPRSQASGYWGDITRTVVRGRASDRLKSLFHTVLKGQSIALEKVRPGVTGQEVHRAVLEDFNRKGYETGLRNGRMEGFFHGTGHGVGLEIHEAPRLGPSGRERLNSGHLVTAEPGLYYPGTGGVRIEDLVLVTSTGNRNLTRFPKYLEI